MIQRGVQLGSRVSGVTLIELLVTVAIIAILALVIYPTYQMQAGRVWRMQAIGCLEELAQGMERRFNTQMSYAGTGPPPNGCVVDGDPQWAVPDPGLAARYGFGFATAPNATSFTLVATPTAQQQADDRVDCRTLSLDQAGTRTNSASADPSICW